ncbi:MAG: hypothetical protein ACOYJU_04435, partial [Anaerovoracaceae bacterium]
QGITKNKPLVHKLIRKHFLKERVQRYIIQEKLLIPLVKKIKSTNVTSIYEQLLFRFPNLPMDACFFSNDLGVWMRDDYERSHKYLSAKIHVTGNGVVVRSKDEKEIGNILEMKCIAYRYEWIQYMHGIPYAPDFAVRRESDDKIIFWEHFGMINDETYREKIYKKLLAYQNCGLHLWDNLIITFPDPSGALDSHMLHRICELFLR